MSAYFLVACSDNLSEINKPFGSSPLVVSTVPVNAATGVSVHSIINITFDQSMDVNTLNTDTITATVGLVSIPGEINYDDSSRTAKFSPNQPLPVGSKIDITLSKNIKSSVGYSLVFDSSYSFITTNSIQPWAKVYRESKYVIQKIIKITPLGDGGNIVFGEFTNSSSKDVWVSKMNEKGVLDWQYTLGNNGTDYFSNGLVLSDNNIIVIGRNLVSKSSWLVKLNGLGQEIWAKDLDGVSIYGAQTLENGNIILAGIQTDSTWIAEITGEGDVTWNQKIVDTNVQFHHISRDKNNNAYLLGADITTPLTLQNAYLMKISSNGNIIWLNKLYLSDGLRLTDLAIDSSENILLTGFSSLASTSELLVIRLSIAGTILSQSSQSFPDFGGHFTIATVYDNSFYIAGYMDNEAVVQIYDASDTVIERHVFDGRSFDTFRDIKLTNDGGLIMVGYTASLDGGFSRGLIIKSRINLGVSLSSAADIQLKSGALPLVNTGSVSMESYAVSIETITDALFQDKNNVIRKPTNMLVETLSGVIGITAKPTNINAQAAAATNSINVSWTDNANDESGYIVFQSLDDVNYSRVYMSPVEVDVTNYTVTNLTPGTGYYFKVIAYNESGYSQYSNSAYLLVP